MSNPWFRMYCEFATDPKVQSMSEAMQRRLTMLFCLQGKGELTKLSMDEIAFALRIDRETLHETLQLFQDKGFTDENGHLINWDRRQYRSDNSTDRVKKYRAKTKGNNDETKVKRFSNAEETSPDTETDSDKKKTEKEKFVRPDWIPADAWRDYEEMRNRIRKPMTDRARVLAVSDLDKLRAEGWDPRTILESAVKNSWQGLFAPKFGATPTGAAGGDGITREITRDEYDRAKRMIGKTASKKGLQAIIDEYEKRNPTQAGKPSNQPQRQDFSTADAG